MEQRRLITLVFSSSFLLFWDHSTGANEGETNTENIMSHYMIETYKRVVKKLEMKSAQ